MKTKQQIEARITEVEKKLDETLEDVNYSAGPTRDAMRLVIPMMKDMCSLMREVLEHDA